MAEFMGVKRRELPVFIGNSLLFFIKSVSRTMLLREKVKKTRVKTFSRICLQNIGGVFVELYKNR